MGTDKSLRRNGSGYTDPTAYNAIKTLDTDDDAERFHRLLRGIEELCKESDFEKLGRIIVKDNRSGKIWR